ncbi:META domain-containing protein [Actinophytocola gossypii]|uniref:META domain-containing protein n=1 Tax=Actinophytocola gossypii TaxID=2812003 RepID=A0ABT2JEE5_9PSEU|nr:META domain-containing protein [Actinophytocola gossypii]MCT2586252.1 META domain-containing protein [Actinophytocola gossypii]
MRRGWMLVLVLVVAGCGQPPASTAPGIGTVSPAGAEYVLSEATVGGRPHALVAGTTVSLDFTDDGELRANAGCNHLRWRVSLDDGTLSTEGGEMTEMGCDEPRHAQDRWLTEFLGGGPSWELDGSRLVLRGGDTELVFTDREVAEPDRPLVGPVWTVDTLVDGQTASSTPTGAAAATVEFGEGRLTVFTGCNGGSAAYTVSGDTIEVDALVLTRKACAPDIMRVEEAVVAVLDGTVTYAVSAEVLTLEHPSGKGLRLRAE